MLLNVFNFLGLNRNVIYGLYFHPNHIRTFEGILFGADLDISGKITGTPILYLGTYKYPILVTRDANNDYVYRIERVPEGFNFTEIYRTTAGYIKAITEARGLLFIAQEDGIVTVNMETGESSIFTSAITKCSSIASRDGADLLVGTEDGKVYYIDASDKITDKSTDFGLTTKVVSTVYAHSIDKWVVGSVDGKVKFASPDFSTIEDKTSAWGAGGLGFVIDIPGLGVILIHGNTIKLFDGTTWVTITTGLTNVVLAYGDYFEGVLILLDNSGKVEVANIPRLKHFNNTVPLDYSITPNGSSLGIAHYIQ